MSREQVEPVTNLKDERYGRAERTDTEAANRPVPMTRNAGLGHMPPYGRDALESHAGKQYKRNRRAVAEQVE